MRFTTLQTIRTFMGILLITTGCSHRVETQQEEAGIKEREQQRLVNKRMLRALPKTVPSPVNNPHTFQKAELGRLLFFDPVLSGNQDVACATCHHPSHGYAEFRDLPIGVNGIGFGGARRFASPNEIPFTKRNTPTILNTAFNGIQNNRPYDPEAAPMFWDLHTQSLEKQILRPLQALEEMRGPHFTEAQILEEIVRRLSAIPEYGQRFAQAFPEPNPVTMDNVGKAIAAFERTLVTNHSRFDGYQRGYPDALSLAEKHGLETFERVGCVNCHNGPMLSDFEPHVLGVPHNDKLEQPDLGIADSHAFRTPTLRNLHVTAPYMHNGAFASLEEVLEFYEDIALNQAKRLSVPYEQVDNLAKQLTLKTRDIAPIITFLKSLDGDRFDKRIPPAVPSGLPVGGNISNAIN